MQGCDILRKEGEDITPRCIVGLAVWLTGWMINLHSDHILRDLRKPGQTGEPSGLCMGDGVIELASSLDVIKFGLSAKCYSCRLQNSKGRLL